jgi:plasmid maintenance system killer protein
VRVEFSDRFLRSYDAAPLRVQHDFDKQLTYLLANPRHPSLNAKKYDEARDLWQARVNRSWRFYFTLEGDMYRMVDIMPHPK